MKSIQSELEKALRGQQDLSLEVSRTAEAEKEARLENDIMHRLVDRYRSRVRTMKKHEARGAMEGRRCSVMEDTLSAKSSVDLTVQGGIHEKQ